MALLIQKAEKKKRKLRLAIVAVSKAGKTFTALKFARALAGPDGRIGVIDTEGGNSTIYQGHPEVGDFDIIVLDEFSPTIYIEAMNALVKHGVDVIVEDSLSHAWSGRGGCLEIVDKAGSGNAKFTGGWSKATPLHNDLIAAINSCPVHLIATMRQKADYVLETDARGKQIPKRVGMAAVQREGMEYEFDVTGTMENCVLTIDGIRGTELEGFLGKEFTKPGAEFIDMIRANLDNKAYVAPVERPKAPPQQPPRQPAPEQAPEKSLYDRAWDAINAAQYEDVVNKIHVYAEGLHTKKQLTADQWLKLSTRCDERIAGIKLENPEPEPAELAPI